MCAKVREEVRVLHVMPDVSRAFGGPTQSLIGYARAARSAGVHVSVAAPRPPADDATWLHSQLPGVSCHFFRSVGRDARAFSPGLLVRLARQSGRFEVVHVHGLFNPISSLSARLCRRQRQPFVLRPFGTLSRYTFRHRRSTLKRFYFRAVDRPSVRAAGGLHFTTTAERDEAARHDVEFGNRAFVAPPPFRGAYVGPGPKVSAPTALFLSRLHPKKNIGGLLNAWRRVLDDVPEAHLVIAGTGKESYVDDLKRQTAALGLQENVSFPGFVKGRQKQKLLTSSHVFVLPSHQENFGVAVLEAVAAGLPVVISPEVQLADFVERHRLGAIVERGPAPLADALVRALGSEPLRQRCAAEGPRRVKEHFSPEAVGRKLREMYERVST